MAEELSDAGPSYRRMPGRGRKTTAWIGLATVNTIWLASDHLLLRESVYGLSESYKRFYFRDIQAFIVRRSPRWIAWISIWTVLSLVFTFCWGMTQRRGWGWPVMAALCFFLAMIQLARGPSCVTYLLTAVQRELLGSLNTLRKARRVLKTVVPLIEEKQGKFDSSSVAEPGAPPLRAASSATRAVIPAAPVTPSISVRPSRIHLALFITTFIGGCVALGEAFRSSTVTLIGAAILLAAIIVLAVITLALQGRRRVSKLVAALTWTITVGYIVAWIVIYTVYSTSFALQQAVERASTHQPPNASFDVPLRSLRQMHTFGYVVLIYGACSAALGVAGVSALFINRPRLNAPPPLPAQSGADRGP
ncbi:MAG: hypothetical protein ABR611_02910 [Chthoniobacterales bacterium]